MAVQSLGRAVGITSDKGFFKIVITEQQRKDTKLILYDSIIFKL